jgi:hypothetical protein
MKVKNLVLSALFALLLGSCTPSYNALDAGDFGLDTVKVKPGTTAYVLARYSPRTFGYTDGDFNAFSPVNFSSRTVNHNVQNVEGPIPLHGPGE